MMALQSSGKQGDNNLLTDIAGDMSHRSITAITHSNKQKTGQTFIIIKICYPKPEPNDTLVPAISVIRR